MPPEFRFPEDAGLWMPLALDDELRTTRRAHLYTLIGRLKSGVTLEQARSEMRMFSAVIDPENKGVDPDGRHILRRLGSDWLSQFYCPG
jgi:hypothetical protein